MEKMKITLKCNNRIALSSLDHQIPLGARRDNSANSIFNEKLCNLYNERSITLLDIGCSGGAFVRQMLDDGHIAVGLEGSDYSKTLHRGAWGIIPNMLFTCDVTKPFRLYLNGKQMLFNVVTAWEFMEHIQKKDLDQLIRNVMKHMAPGGIWIMSITNGPSIVNGVEYHVTKEQKEWWIKKFASYGLINVPDYIKYFNTQFVRGKYESLTNFHLAVCKDPTAAPKIPKIKLGRWLWERWVGTKTQIRLKQIINGDL